MRLDIFNAHCTGRLPEQRLQSLQHGLAQDPLGSFGRQSGSAYRLPLHRAPAVERHGTVGSLRNS